MKRPLSIIREQKGFILPSVLFLSTITILFVSTNISAYSHDLTITYRLIDQMKAQSLFQMGYSQYKHDFSTQDITEEMRMYTFPDGMVHVTPLITEESIYLNFEIRTDHGFLYNVTKSLELNLEDTETKEQE